ncbi:MAG: hypothetical protein IKA49_05310 [Alistipes sp.]|nr:hypothetical protein [Alistipes sp.]
MRLLNRILTAIVIALCCISCIDHGHAESGDLQLLDINSERRIYVSGVAGEKSSFRIKSLHNWKILEDKHFLCSPSSGGPGEDIRIEITARNSNNSTDTLFLDNITFRLLSTRFVGVTAYQLPRLKISSRSILLSSEEGSCSELHVTTDADYTAKPSDGAEFTLSDNGDGIIKIFANENGTDSERQLGKIRLWLNEAPESVTTIEVRQRAHIVVPQTIVCYMVGTSLGGYFNSNIQQMLDCVSNNILGESRLLVLKTESSKSATLYELRYDAKLGKGVKDVVKSVSLPTPYNAALFESILTEITGIAPAERYGLIIGSHGLGWIPKDFTPDYDVGELSLFSTDAIRKLWTPAEGALPTRHIGDGREEVRFNTTEISEAVKGSKRKFDYILFDACFMGNIETLYDLRNSADYIIGSPCEVMAAGFPYGKILPLLLLNNGTDYDLDKVCKTYVDHYLAASIKSACVALTKCDELEALAATLVAVNNAAKREQFNLDNVQAYEGLNINYNPAHVFYDLEDLVEQSCADEEAVKAFKAQLDKTVSSRYHTEGFYSTYNADYNIIKHYCGVSTSAMVELYAPVWVNTAWYDATH